jgi:hypothetical protein
MKLTAANREARFISGREIPSGLESKRWTITTQTALSDRFPPDLAVPRSRRLGLFRGMKGGSGRAS